MSVSKAYDQDAFEVRVFFFKNSKDSFKVYVKKHAEKLDSAIKAEESVKDGDPKKQKHFKISELLLKTAESFSKLFRRASFS